VADWAFSSTDRAFEASMPECPDDSVESRVEPLVVLLHGAWAGVRQAGDICNEPIVDETPFEPRRENSCDQSAAASVLPAVIYFADHGWLRVQVFFRWVLRDREDFADYLSGKMRLHIRMSDAADIGRTVACRTRDSPIAKLYGR